MSPPPHSAMTSPGPVESMQQARNAIGPLIRDARHAYKIAVEQQEAQRPCHGPKTGLVGSRPDDSVNCRGCALTVAMSLTPRLRDSFSVTLAHQEAEQGMSTSLRNEIAFRRFSRVAFESTSAATMAR